MRHTTEISYKLLIGILLSLILLGISFGCKSSKVPTEPKVIYEVRDSVRVEIKERTVTKTDTVYAMFEFEPESRDTVTFSDTSFLEINTATSLAIYTDTGLIHDLIGKDTSFVDTLYITDTVFIADTTTTHFQSESTETTKEVEADIPWWKSGLMVLGAILCVVLILFALLKMIK